MADKVLVIWKDKEQRKVCEIWLNKDLIYRKRFAGQKIYITDEELSNSTLIK